MTVLIQGANSPYGSGTINTIPKWITPNSLGDSGITDDGSTVAIASRNVTLTSTSGNVAVGAGATSSQNMQVTGRFMSMATAPVALAANNTALIVSASGTYDATGGQRISTAFSSGANATRSAGASNVINRAIVASASGGQINVAFQNTTGDNFFNSASGSTGFGYGITATLPTTVAITGTFLCTDNAAIGQSATRTHSMQGSMSHTMDGTSTRGYDLTMTPAAATTQRIGAAYLLQGTFDTTGTAITAIGLFGAISSTRSAGANNLVNIGILGNAAGGQFNIALQTNSGNCFLNATTGSTGVGVTNNTTTLVARLQVAATVSAQTSNFGAVRGTVSGTYDTTGGALLSQAVVGIATSTRSAGASNLSNFGGTFTASGAQINIALQTNDGDILLGTVSGNFTMGSATTSTQTFTFNGRSATWTTAPSAITTSNTLETLSAAGTFNTTAGVLSSTGLSSSVTSTRSAGANALTNTAGTFTASGAQVNRALVTVSGDIVLGSTDGNVTIGSATTSTQTVTFTGRSASWSTAPSALAASNTLETLSAAGTIDATAAVRTSGGISVSVTTTRSAGANNLTNLAGTFTATGAQVNIALNTVSGDNYFNSTAGSAGFGYAIGAALPKKVSITGDLYVSTELEIDGVLNHDGTSVGLFAVAPAVQQTITGSRGGNAALADLLTKGVLNGYWIDGTTA